MPIIFTDNYTCERCGKVFEWNYFELIRQNIDSPKFIVESMPQGKPLAHSCRQRDNGFYDIEINCPNCNFDNHFTFIAK